MSVPPEVVDHVIDFLHDDSRALSSCALVSRTWLPRSRYHRFAAVSLPIPFHGSFARCTKFRQMLDRNPDLIPYVQSLRLDAVGYLGHAVSWTEAEPLKSPGLLNIRSLTLSRFRFRSLADLVPTISSLPLLEELSLERITVLPDPGACTPHPTVDQPRACRPLKSLSFTGEPIGESVLEEDSAVFASALMDAGGLAPDSLRSLALLSGARGCSGWLPFLPYFAASLRHCAVSLHENLALGELTEESRENVFRVYDTIRGCNALRSLCIQYNATSSLVQHYLEGLTHTIPTVSPFYIEALADMLEGPGEPLCPLLEQLTLDVVGSPHSLRSCTDAFRKLARALCNNGNYPSFARVLVRIYEPKYVVGLFRNGGQADSAGDGKDGRLRDLLREFETCGIDARVEVHEVLSFHVQPRW